MSKRVDAQFQQIAEEFGVRAAEVMLDLSWYDYKKYFQSEIEHLMAVALRAMDCGYGWEFDGNQEVVQEWSTTQDCPIVQIQPRRKLGRYEITLAVRVRNQSDKIFKAAIQCDGHDLHEMSAEQAAEEGRFERALNSAGYRLIRFAGSDVANDAASCAAKVAKEIGQFISPRRRRNS